MKTKKFYSFLLAACCVMTMVSLTSCHPDDEDDDNNGNGGDSKTKIEYVEFKEPCLMKGATKDEVMAWMAVNMPEYELDEDSYDTHVSYYLKDNYEGIIYYQFYKGSLYGVGVNGPFRVEQVFDLLDKKYGDKKLEESSEVYGVKADMYTYSCSNSKMQSIGVLHLHGINTLTKSYQEQVTVTYNIFL